MYVRLYNTSCHGIKHISCYLTHVMLFLLYNMSCYVIIMCDVMLYNSCDVMLYNMCHVMLYNRCHVLF